MGNVANWVSDHRQQLMAGFAVLAVIVLVIGLCFSWFVHNKSLSTVGAVKAPYDLKLMGPNETTIEQIDLTYDPKRDVDKDGYVTLKKAFCVSSDTASASYDLFLAHTTNISGLEIKLYRAKAEENPDKSDAKADAAGLDGAGNPFAWNITGSDLIPQGSYINKDASTGKADTDHDAQTFDEKLGADKLERSASPLYWKLSGQNTGTDSTGTDKVDNYIIQLKWKETQKETDVLYLIAKAAS